MLKVINIVGGVMSIDCGLWCPELKNLNIGILL